jgi:hypothetical protein
MVINAKTFSCKLLVILARFQRKLNFPDRFSEKLRYRISSRSYKMEPSCSMRTEGLTDMTKLLVPFRKFVNAPRKERTSRSSEGFELAIPQPQTYALSHTCTGIGSVLVDLTDLRSLEYSLVHLS